MPFVIDVIKSDGARKDLAHKYCHHGDIFSQLLKSLKCSAIL